MTDDERRAAADMGQGQGHDNDNPVTGSANGLKDGNGQAASHAPVSSPTKEEEAGFGAALRAIYRQTVDEAIPAEMLDLLRRLD